MVWQGRAGDRSPYADSPGKDEAASLLLKVFRRPTYFFASLQSRSRLFCASGSARLAAKLHRPGHNDACSPEAVYNPLAQMMGSTTARARIVAAVFTVAMFYASVCSTMCAAGVCPNELRHSASGDACNQMPAGHSDGTQKHAPENRDCSMHHHPTANIVQADNLPQFQLTSTGHINASDLLANSAQVMAFSLAAFSLSDLAPPPTLRSPLYQHISVLRI